MAKRHKNRQSSRRDPPRIAKALDPVHREVLVDPALPDFISPIQFHEPVRSKLTEFEDRRLYRPDRAIVSPRSSRRSSVRLVVPAKPVKRSVTHFVSPTVSFSAPNTVLVCVRRKRRREVLFAKGKGGGGKRPPRRNFWSKVRC